MSAACLVCVSTVTVSYTLWTPSTTAFSQLALLSAAHTNLPTALSSMIDITETKQLLCNEFIDNYLLYIVGWFSFDRGISSITDVSII